MIFDPCAREGPLVQMPGVCCTRMRPSRTGPVPVLSHRARRPAPSRAPRRAAGATVRSLRCAHLLLPDLRKRRGAIRVETRRRHRVVELCCIWRHLPRQSETRRGKQGEQGEGVENSGTGQDRARARRMRTAIGGCACVSVLARATTSTHGASQCGRTGKYTAARSQRFRARQQSGAARAARSSTCGEAHDPGRRARVCSRCNVCYCCAPCSLTCFDSLFASTSITCPAREWPLRGMARGPERGSAGTPLPPLRGRGLRAAPPPRLPNAPHRRAAPVRRAGWPR